VNRLHGDLGEILRTDDTERAFAGQGAEAMNVSRADFQKRIVSEMARWAAVVKELGLPRE
jgi:tripartite-type tricarboxylate transporter receptor subunit TctC